MRVFCQLTPLNSINCHLGALEVHASQDLEKNVLFRNHTYCHGNFKNTMQKPVKKRSNDGNTQKSQVCSNYRLPSGKLT